MAVTPFYAGVLALFYLVLSLRVVTGRQRGFPLGDGGDMRMLRRIRGHGNFSEYVPFILLMMGFLEFSHASVHLLHALGIMLVASRLLHGYSLSFTDRFRFGRVWGAALTFLVLAACGVLCVAQGIRGMLLV
ncbi:MAG TPA: MAPEG family protein [Burkholderiales bacterium]|nr:MAPEG family protein [Burkholderiales bacterium]